MSPRLDPKRIPVSTGLRRSQTVSERRCTQCGLRLHVRLVAAGITEHVLCTVVDPSAYDALLVERFGPAKALERERRRM